MHNELQKMKKEATLKPQFFIADKWVEVQDIPENAISAHLDEQLAMRDALADTSRPSDRIKTFKKMQQ